jgi:hypothetical protein
VYVWGNGWVIAMLSAICESAKALDGGAARNSEELPTVAAVAIPAESAKKRRRLRESFIEILFLFFFVFSSGYQTTPDAMGLYNLHLTQTSYRPHAEFGACTTSGV